MRLPWSFCESRDPSTSRQKTFLKVGGFTKGLAELGDALEVLNREMPFSQCHEVRKRDSKRSSPDAKWDEVCFGWIPQQSQGEGEDLIVLDFNRQKNALVDFVLSYLLDRSLRLGALVIHSALGTGKTNLCPRSQERPL